MAPPAVPWVVTLVQAAELQAGVQAVLRAVVQAVAQIQTVAPAVVLAAQPPTGTGHPLLSSEQLLLEEQKWLRVVARAMPGSMPPGQKDCRALQKRGMGAAVPPGPPRAGATVVATTSEVVVSVPMVAGAQTAAVEPAEPGVGNCTVRMAAVAAPDHSGALSVAAAAAASVAVEAVAAAAAAEPSRAAPCSLHTPYCTPPGCCGAPPCLSGPAPWMGKRHMCQINEFIRCTLTHSPPTSRSARRAESRQRPGPTGRSAGCH